MDKPEFRVERGPTTHEAAAILMAKLLEREGKTVAADMLRQLHAENQRLCAQHANLLLDTRCAKAQRDALLAALKTYGWHAEDCPQYPTWTRPEKWPDCTCGFDAAIKAVEGEKK